MMYQVAKHPERLVEQARREAEDMQEDAARSQGIDLHTDDDVETWLDLEEVADAYASYYRTSSRPAVIELVECGTYGCKRMKPKNSVFCKACAEEYREDPDAFK